MSVKIYVHEVELDSNKISVVEILPFQGVELYISYKGVVSGNEIH